MNGLLNEKSAAARRYPLTAIDVLLAARKNGSRRPVPYAYASSDSVFDSEEAEIILNPHSFTLVSVPVDTEHFGFAAETDQEGTWSVRYVREDGGALAESLAVNILLHRLHLEMIRFIQETRVRDVARLVRAFVREPDADGAFMRLRESSLICPLKPYLSRVTTSNGTAHCLITEADDGSSALTRLGACAWNDMRDRILEAVRNA
jgi:hypothetical protein